MAFVSIRNYLREVTSLAVCFSHVQNWRDEPHERFICQSHETRQAGRPEDDSTSFSQCNHACLQHIMDVRAAAFQSQNVQCGQIFQNRSQGSRLVLPVDENLSYKFLVTTTLSSHSSYRLMKARYAEARILAFIIFTLELDIDMLKNDLDHMYPVRLPWSNPLNEPWAVKLNDKSIQFM